MRTLSMLSRLAAFIIVLIASLSGSQANEVTDPIQDLVGQWLVPNSETEFRIGPDHTVQHSFLGQGDIAHLNATIFRVQYRQRDLICEYNVKRYSDAEVAFVVSSHPSSDACELGVLKALPDADHGNPAGAKTNGLTAAAIRALPTGTAFKDCSDCPDMMIIPAGRFVMGSPEPEHGRRTIESPQHEVAIGHRLAVARFAVTRETFQAFVDETKYAPKQGCQAAVSDGAGEQWAEQADASYLRPPQFQQDGRHPVVCVNWNDAVAYAQWLSAKTHAIYRLPTEAEREYFARAGTQSTYWWGETVESARAHYDQRVRDSAAPKLIKAKSGNAQPPVTYTRKLGTVPVDAYLPNPWGLYGVLGSVGEWTADCWNTSYLGLPADGAAAQVGDCKKRVLRGGGWAYWPEDIRSAYREAAPMDDRYSHVGFRLVREIP